MAPTEKNQKNKNQCQNNENSDNKNSTQENQRNTSGHVSETLSQKAKLTTNIKFVLKNQETQSLKDDLKEQLHNHFEKIKRELPEIEKYILRISNEKEKKVKLEQLLRVERSSNSSDNIQITEIMIEQIEDLLYNIFQNTFLKSCEEDNLKNDEKKIKNFKHQITNNIFKIYSSKEFSLKKNFTSNFFKWFNLGIPIPKDLFDKISLKDKIKLLCYIFCKYINTTQIQYLFNVSLNFERELEDTVPFDLYVERDIPNYIKYQTILETKKSQLFLKRILSMIIHQIELFHKYLHLKKNLASFDSTELLNSLQETEKNLFYYVKQQEDIKKGFFFNQELEKESFVFLVNKINIIDLQLLIIISNISFDGDYKERKKKIFYQLADEKSEFNMTKFERDFFFRR